MVHVSYDTKVSHSLLWKILESWWLASRVGKRGAREKRDYVSKY